MDRIPGINPDGQTQIAPEGGDLETIAAVLQPSAVTATTPVRVSEAVAGVTGRPVAEDGLAAVEEAVGAVADSEAAEASEAAVVSEDRPSFSLAGVPRINRKRSRRL